MKITFPYMGTSHLVISFFLKSWATKLFIRLSFPKTLSLGVKYAPEFACLPFKILLGTYWRHWN